MNEFNEKLRVHFIGVGGAGTSLLCRFLLSKNFYVSGSDVCKSKVVEDLISLGLEFNNNHDASVIDNVDVVVYGNAIKEDNVELSRARFLSKAIYKRSELLDLIIKSHKKSIGVSGTHGKTTSTSMLTKILIDNGVNLTSMIGGESLNTKSFTYSGKNDVIVSEVCEYEKSIRDISVLYPVCLNVDNDHLDSYGNIFNLKEEFYNFLSRGKIKFINADDYYLKKYKGKRTVTFGIKNDCDYRAVNLTSNNGKYSFYLKVKGSIKCKVILQVYGIHNVYNALSAIAVANKVFGIDFDNISRSLLGFIGVKRRFETIKTNSNKNVICDYAHHPTEIVETLRVMKELFGNDYAVVFQPHTYSRTKLLFDDFVCAFENEETIIFKEYPARERYDKTASAYRLCRCIKNSKYVADVNRLVDYIKKLKVNNVIVLGAGDLYDKIKNAD